MSSIPLSVGLRDRPSTLLRGLFAPSHVPSPLRASLIDLYSFLYGSLTPILGQLLPLPKSPTAFPGGPTSLSCSNRHCLPYSSLKWQLFAFPPPSHYWMVYWWVVSSYSPPASRPLLLSLTPAQAPRSLLGSPPGYSHLFLPRWLCLKP